MVSVSIPGRTGEDGVLEGFWFSSAAGAGKVWVLIEPGGVCGQVAFCRSHLVDSPCHELSKTHEGVWGKGGGVVVVGGCGGVDGPILEEHVPSSDSKYLVGSFHEVR